MGIRIAHETHRGRILYNPWITRDLCVKYADLKLTADLSHFCVVAERVFAHDDADWMEVMEQVAAHTIHIHARVGYAQGPQVSTCTPLIHIHTCGGGGGGGGGDGDGSRA